jgi:hypothetical protein
LLDGSAPLSSGGDRDEIIIYYNWGWTRMKAPRDTNFMAGGACISYTGTGPWNKNLNLVGKN